MLPKNNNNKLNLKNGQVSQGNSKISIITKKIQTGIWINVFSTSDYHRTEKCPGLEWMLVDKLLSGNTDSVAVGILD